MNRRTGLVLVLCVGCAQTLSACCGSLLCNAKKVAAAKLDCDGDELQVNNQAGYQGNDRTLQVNGCGKQATVVCTPTNLQAPPAEKVRGQVITPQNRLDLKWSCHADEAVAHQNTAKSQSGS